MTLDELKVIITANIEQVAPAIRQAQAQFQSLGNAAVTASQTAAQKAQTAAQQMQRAVQDANKQAQTAVEQTAKTEQSAQQAGVKAAQEAAKAKIQSLEEIEAIAQRASERAAGVGTTIPNADELLASQHAESSTPSTMASSLYGRPAESAEEETPEVNTAPTQNALQRLLGLAQQVRERVSGMFTGADTGAENAASAENLLNSKLEITQQKIEMLVSQLAQLQSEYGRISAASGADDPAAIKLQTQILNTRSQLVSLRTTANSVQTQIQELGESEDRASASTSRLGSSMGGASAQSSQLGNMISRIPSQLFRMIVVYQLAFRGLQSIASYTMSALETNNQFSDSLNNLKVRLLTAFYPIYQAALPAITALVQALAKAMAYIAAFISGLFGTTYQQSEQGAAALNKNINAMKNAATTAKDQAEATKKQNQYEKEMQSYNDRLTRQQEEYARAVQNAENRQDKLNKAREDAKSILGIDEINALGKTVDQSDSTVQMPLEPTPIQPPTPPNTDYAIPAATSAGSALENTDFNTKPLIPQSAIDAAQAVGEKVRAIFEGINGVVDTVADHMQGFFGDIGKGAVICWNNAKIIFGMVKNYFVAFWNDIWRGAEIWGENIGAAVNSVKDYFGGFFGDAQKGANICWSEIQGAFGDVRGYFVQSFNDAKNGAVTAWNDAPGIFGSVWNAIKGIFGDVGGWFRDRFTDAKNLAQNAWSTASGFFGGVWNGIQGAFGDVNGWFAQHFGNSYDVITRVWNGLPGFFGSIWNDIVWGVRSFVNDIIYPINCMIAGIDNIQFNVPGWVPVLGGDHFGLSIPQIHYLATGGITTGATMAMIGEAGQEAVLPLQNNTGWMDTLASRIVSQIPSGGGSGGDVHLELTVKYGDETIARKQIKAINRLQKASGRTLITV